MILPSNALEHESLAASAATAPRRSLGRQIRYGLLLAVVLSLLPTAAVLIALAYQAQVAQLALVQQERSRAAAIAIDAYLADIQRRLGYLSRVRGFAEEPAGVQERLLEALLRQDAAFAMVVVADEAGAISAMAAPDGTPRLASVAELPEFETAITRQEEVHGPVAVDPKTGTPHMTVALPVRDARDRVAGVLLARVRLDYLWFVVASTRVGESGYAYVVDQRNILIAERARAPEHFELRPLDHVVAERLRNHTSVAGAYEGLYGAQVYGAFAPIPATGWRVGVELPVEEARAPLRQMLKVMLLALLLALLLAGGIGILFARRIVEPLRQLTGAAARLSAGDLRGQVLVPRHDELGTLARSFNEMTRRLHDYFALHADLQFSRSITAATPDLIYVYDLTIDRNVYVNRETVPILGIAADELERLGNGLMAAIMHPEDFATLGKHMSRLAALGDGEALEREYRLRGADGKWRWVHGREVIFARDERGAPSKILGVVQDISERKHAEQTLQLLAEVGGLLATSLDYEATLARVAQLMVPTAADLCTIHLVDPDGALRQLAVGHGDQRVVAQIWELERQYPLDPQDPCGLPQVVRSAEPELVAEFDDGRVRQFAQDALHLERLRALGLASSLCMPLVARGHTLGAISFFYTSSGRRYSAGDLALAEELAGRAALAIDNARLYREARDALRDRDQFLQVASHELKTPLTSLLGYTDLLRRRTGLLAGLSERDRRVLRVIGEQAARLNQMISAMLDLSRIQTGQLNAVLRPLDICALVRQAVEELRPALDIHSLELDCGDEPLLIQGDELRIYQVLHNILNNALKYSPDGGAIRVRVERGASQVQIAISDEGIGIPEAALPRLFQRYYRAHSDDATTISGMGLGLYVVKEIVSLHGGEIGVSSREGQGSTFTIRLPLAGDDALLQLRVGEGARLDKAARLGYPEGGESS
jgi:PAS domain S-box-containing protein